MKIATPFFFNKSSDLIVLFSILSVLGSGTLVWLQIEILSQVLISPAQVKQILAVLMFAWIVAYFFAVSCKPVLRGDEKGCESNEILFLIIFFCSILFYCLMIICYFSSVYVGLSNAIGAFMYNYSLFIFIVPFALIYMHRMRAFGKQGWWGSRKVWAVFAGIAAASSILQIFQVIMGGPLIMWESEEIKNVAFEGQFIKFDQIGGVYRAQGIYRSPLEAGMCGSLFTLMAIEKWLHDKKQFAGLLLVVLFAVGVVMTGSRTAYILLGVSFFAMVFFEFISSRKASSRILMLFGLCLFALCLGYFLDFFSYSEDGFVAAMINPTNLLIRLENWNGLLSDLLVSPWKFIFGLGIVQNGNYGEYHAIIIDNTYVGMLLTAGVLGLLAWFVFMLFWVLVTYKQQRKIIGRSYVLISYLLGFLFASLTENMMHFAFYVVLAYLVYLSFRSRENKRFVLSCEDSLHGW